MILKKTFIASILFLSFFSQNMAQSCPDIFISEYVEGTSLNKALELYNPTSSTIDLSQLTLKRFENGSPIATDVLNLFGTLAPGQTFSICGNGANATLKAACDTAVASNVFSFNGNDALGLFRGVDTLDIFGKIGEDPGLFWSGGGVITQDVTLRRKPSIIQGVNNNPATFDPSLEWLQFNVDDFSDIGSHTVNISSYPIDSISNTICQGDTLVFGSQNLTTAGIYFDTTLNGLGCDSITVLNLSIDTSQNCGLIGDCEDLFISEYVEGSSFNKALEIYNPTNTIINLAGYEVKVFNNGSNTPNAIIALTGNVNPNDVYVIAHGSSANAFQTQADLIFGLGFNGNDAIALFNPTGDTLDIFGKIGEDPGSAGWSGLTANNTLVRKSTIQKGVQNNPATFDPNIEWDIFPIDDSAHIGSHTSICAGCPTVYDTINDTICQGDSIVFGGNAIYIAGTYFDTITNNGCDTITQLDLVVNPNVIPTISISANANSVCQGQGINFASIITNGGTAPTYQWKKNGNNVGTGLPTYNSPAANTNNGDTVYCILTSNEVCANPNPVNSDTIVVKVNPVYNDTIADTICVGDTLVFGGQNLTAAGTYSDTSSTAAGCDSITTINLAIDSNCCPTIYRDTADYQFCIGDTLTLNGNIITTTGTYYDTISNNGCDTIDTYNITFNSQTTYITDLTIDNWGSETNILIFDLNGNLINFASGFPDNAPGNNYIINHCLVDSCIEYVLYDSFGDGFASPGQAILTNANNSTLLVANSTNHTGFIFSDTVCINDTCVTVYDTSNYQFCQGDTLTLNGNPITTTGTYYDTIGSFGCDTINVYNITFNSQVTYTTNLTIDNFGSETNILIFDLNGNLINFASGFPDNASGNTYTINHCLVDSCIEYMLYDSFGDGFFVPGQAIVTDANGDTVLAASDTNHTGFIFSDTLCNNICTIYDTIYDTICQGDTIVFAGNLVFNAGTYYDTTQVNGCDSISQLNLAIDTSAGCGVIGDCEDLFISEYVEGSSFNKALEIYNPTNTIINLAGYEVKVFNNGSTTPNAIIALTGNVNPNDVYVIAHGSSANAFQTQADLIFGLGFNGNDAIALFNPTGDTLDIFGKIGEDPGSAGWSGLTANNTLVRKSTIQKGVQNNPATFDPNIEWDIFPIDDSAHIGSHTSICAGCPTVYDTINDTICQGDSIVFGGNAIYIAGTYFDTITNNGCDTITQLDLVVNPNVIPTISISANANSVCQGQGINFASIITNGGTAPTYQWKKNGNNVGTGLPTYNSPAANTNNGDTVYCILTSNEVCANPNPVNSDTIVVKVNPVYNDTIADTICVGDTLVFGGQNLTAAGTYSDTSSTAAGCDSITTINLAIDSNCCPTIYRDTADYQFCIGDTLTLNGNIITTTGTYYDTISNNGCDTIDTYNITFNSQTTYITDLTIDNWGSETNILIFDLNGNLINFASGFPDNAPGNNYIINHCLVDSCIEYVLYDSFGDGFASPGQAILTNANNSTLLVANSTNHTGFIFSDTVCINDTCVTVYDTSNYQFCQGDTLTLNGNPITTTGTYYDTIGSFGCDTINVYNITFNSQVTYTTNLTIDNFGSETNILIFDLNGNLINFASGFPDNASGNTYTINHCLVDSCIEYMLYDSFGDGFFVPGQAIVTDANGDTVLAASDTNHTGFIFSDTLCNNICTIYDTIYDTICQGDTIVFAGNLVFNAGTYYDTTQVNGCDSISQLNLAIDTSAGCGVIGDCEDLFISEYVEGSSFNKALEIYNPTNTIINLAGYEVKVFNNGSTTPNAIIALTGNVNPNDVYVIAHGSSANAFQTQADLIFGLGFNGNDAIALFNPTGDTLDIFGKIGEDPGSAGWSGLTANNTLVRKSTIQKGVQNNPATFDPNIEWDIFPIDDSAHIGSHTSICAGCPTVYDTINDTICQGDSIVFGGNAIYIAGTYFDTITNNGCDTITQLDLVVNPNVIPTISISANANSVCQGQGINFASIITNGGTAPTYQWKKNGNNVGTGLPTYNSPAANTNNGDTVYCILTSNEVCANPNPVNSDTIVVKVNPVYNDTIADTICVGDTLVFGGQNLTAAGTYSDTSSTAAGCDSITTINLAIDSNCCPTIYRDTADYQFCIGDTLTLNGNIITTTGTYYDTISNNGCDTIDTYNITFNSQTTYITDLTIDNWGSETNILIFDLNGNLINFASGFPDNAPGNNYIINHCLVDSCIEYVLYDSFGDGFASPGQAILTNANNSTLLVANSTNHTGFIFSDTVCINDTCVTVYDTSNYQFCQGDTLTLNGNPITTTGTYYDTIGSFGCDTINVYNITFNSQVTYTTNLTIDNFGSETNILIFDLNGNLINFASGFPDNASGNTYTINHCLVDSCIEYMLYDSFGDGFFVPGQAIVTDANGDTVLAASDTNHTGFIFSDTLCNNICTIYDTIYDTICQGDTIVFAGNLVFNAGTYYDTTQVNGCDSISQLDLTVIPTITINLSDSLCNGDTIIFGGTIITIPGTYYDTLQAQSTCDSIIMLTVTSVTNVIASVTITVTDSVICPGDIISFNANGVNGGNNPTYQWKQNGNVIGTGTPFSPNTNSISTGDVFTCEMISSMSCASPNPAVSNIITITIGGSASDTIRDTICQGDTVYFGGNTLTTSGYYYDTLISAGGCDSIITFRLHVNPTPLVYANADQDTIGIGGTVNFNPNGSNASIYFWDFGDGNTSPLNTVSHTYNSPGVYTVILRGEAIFGCVAYDTLIIVVINNAGINESAYDNLSIYPNPVNDVLNIKFENVEKVQVQLFSTQGKLISTKVEETKLTSINMTYLERGVYYLHITIGDKLIVKKVIKQ
ncbi:MAG: lamin tail domain-containing protein [Flavobacteriales bacterium]|nr:lamin tail domain-containing protein [Flavobacteriales bacterium]